MEKIIIRKATREDLVSIQELNNSLFELEYENFDDTLKKDGLLKRKEENILNI